MRNLRIFILGFCCLFGLFNLAKAQFPPRIDDHFQRWKVVSRIVMQEKINAPLRMQQKSTYTQKGGYSETNGLVYALINGLRRGDYLAYDPDSLEKSLNYQDVVTRAQKISGGGSSELDGEEGEAGFDDFGGEGDFGADEFAPEGDFIADDMAVAKPSGGGSNADFSMTPYIEVIEIIEDRIFDKVRSDMYYDLQWIRLVWVDPGETLPDKNFICFAYKDVMEILDDTQWKNPFNDAEYRSIREIMELRLYNSYIVSVNDRDVRSLQESEQRKNQIVEFEHNLWHF